MGETFSIQGYSGSNMLMCYIDGDNIIQQDYIGNRKIIGKTESAYSELEQTTQEYYDKLVELGAIVPPKTPEESMREMQKTMDYMTGVIAALAAEIKEMKSNGCKCDNGSGNENVPVGKHSRGCTESARNSEENS